MSYEAPKQEVYSNLLPLRPSSPQHPVLSKRPEIQIPKTREIF
jgi:hypothetical protein